MHTQILSWSAGICYMIQITRELILLSKELMYKPTYRLHEWYVLFLLLHKNLEIDINFDPHGFVIGSSLVSLLFCLLHALPSLLSVHLNFLDFIETR